jgi:glucose dehydrogenase
MSSLARFVLAVLALLPLLPASSPAAEWRDVTEDRLLKAEGDAANWLMYNRTYSGWRYSPLDQVNAGNVKKLVPKWIFAGGTLGDQQMTPIVNDGVMFTTSTSLSLNRVQAVNAVTGALLWKHDRKIPEDVGALVRVIPHNRGVALYKDKVIFGTVMPPLPPMSPEAVQTSRAPSLHGHYPASPLLRARPPPSRRPPISRERRLYG